MVDLAAGVEAKNYGLNTGIELRTLWELFKIVLPLVSIACVLSFYVWVRAEGIRMGYERQRIGQEMTELRQSKQRLIVQEQTLQDPRLMDSMARNSLGMIVLRANQVIPPDADNSGTLKVGSLYRSSWPQVRPALN